MSATAAANATVVSKPVVDTKYQSLNPLTIVEDLDDDEAQSQGKDNNDKSDQQK